LSNQLDKETLLEYLRSLRLLASPIIATDGRATVLDLSVGSRLRGREIDNLGVAEFSDLIDEVMRDADTDFAFGRYAEPRELYSNENFASNETSENRTIHMGLDLFCAADTPIHAPLDGTVELLENNARELDYGPMVVLRHATDTGQVFYTLYGHLSLDTLNAIEQGQEVRAGEQITTPQWQLATASAPATDTGFNEPGRRLSRRCLQEQAGLLADTVAESGSVFSAI